MPDILQIRRADKHREGARKAAVRSNNPTSRWEYVQYASLSLHFKVFDVLRKNMQKGPSPDAFSASGAGSTRMPWSSGWSNSVTSPAHCGALRFLWADTEYTLSRALEDQQPGGFRALGVESVASVGRLQLSLALQGQSKAHFNFFP